MEPTNNNKTTDKIGLIILVLLIIVALSGSAYIYLNFPTKYQVLNYPGSVEASSKGVITISPQGFIPASISLKKGSQLTWQNNDERPHQVIFGPHPVHQSLMGLKNIESPALATNESFTFTFETTGTFSYHDEFNPLNSTGVVIVHD
jgi:plastocyanin